MEEPDLIIDDSRASFRGYRKQTRNLAARRLLPVCYA
jgi:hypothetical protein